MCWAKSPFGGLSMIKTALGPIALLVAHGLSKGQLSGLSMKSWTLHPASYTLKFKLSEGLWQLTALVRLWENKPLKAQKAPPSTEQAAATEIYIHTFVAWCPSSIFCERCLSPNSHIIALPHKCVFCIFLPDLTFFKPGVWKPGVSGTLNSYRQMIIDIGPF